MKIIELYGGCMYCNNIHVRYWAPYINDASMIYYYCRECVPSGRFVTKLQKCCMCDETGKDAYNRGVYATIDNDPYCHECFIFECKGKKITFIDEDK